MQQNNAADDSTTDNTAYRIQVSMIVDIRPCNGVLNLWYDRQG